MKKAILLMILCSLVFSFGCAKKKFEAQPTRAEKVVPAEEVVVEEVQVEEPAQLSPMDIYAQEYANLPTTHVVKKGECLWWIAEYQQIYNDPFMWPLIYKANRAQINDPDLIYPGQEFSVPRQMALNEVTAARKEAGASWKALNPPATSVLPPEMRQELGYGF